MEEGAARAQSGTSNGDIGQGEASGRDADNDSGHGNSVASASAETNGSASPDEVMASARLSVSTQREGALGRSCTSWPHEVKVLLLVTSVSGLQKLFLQSCTEVDQQWRFNSRHICLQRSP